MNERERNGYHGVTPYLIVHGVPALIEFLKKAFDAEEVLRERGASGGLHAEIRIRGSVVMMGEPPGEFTPVPGSLLLSVDDADLMYARAMRAGAQSLMEPSDRPNGDRMAGIKDAAGNLWWILQSRQTHIPPTS